MWNGLLYKKKSSPSNNHFIINPNYSISTTSLLSSFIFLFFLFIFCLYPIYCPYNLAHSSTLVCLTFDVRRFVYISLRLFDSLLSTFTSLPHLIPQYLSLLFASISILKRQPQPQTQPFRLFLHSQCHTK